jgi:hypothetical protein
MRHIPLTILLVGFLPQPYLVDRHISATLPLRLPSMFCLSGLTAAALPSGTIALIPLGSLAVFTFAAVRLVVALLAFAVHVPEIVKRL